jgi:KDO2-lipid IV(A) lauroyltransferase
MPPQPVPPSTGSAAASRCGIDSVELARIERFVDETPQADLQRLFSAQELADAGSGPGRIASLAARFAAKEACLKLFPADTARHRILAEDFSVERDPHGAPRIVLSANAADVAARHRIRAIQLSLTHDKSSASAVALAIPDQARPSLAGRLCYYCLPLRRGVVLANLRRVYDEGVAEDEIRRLAQAHYGHLLTNAAEFIRMRFVSKARRAQMVRVENVEVFADALAQRKGVIVLTGHFGSWEVSTVAGLNQYPEVRGQIYFVRRPLKSRWADALVTRRFQRAGFGVLPKRGGLDAILEVLEAGHTVVFPFDQHAGGRDAIKVDFFGHPAGTMRSLAVLALSTGATVLPAASWREADGRHVLRFESPLPLLDDEDTNEAIRLNSRAYNRALERLVLRHPEQWFWVHRRWKD